MAFAYYDGKWQKEEDVRLPLSERAFFFGDAIYDAALAHRGHVLLESAHLDRFFRNAALLGIPSPVGREALSRLLSEGAERYETAFLYFQLTRRVEGRSHTFPDGAPGSLLITVSESELPSPDDRASLITVPDRRYGFCHVKTVNLLPNVLAAKEAERRGADEAVFVRDGKITECAHSNLFMLKDGTLYTHPTDEHILPGTVRRALLAVAEENGIPTVLRPFSPEEAGAADALFITSTSKLIRTAKSLDGVPLPEPDSLSRFLICSLFSSVFDKIL